MPDAKRTMKLRMVTPERLLFEDEVHGVTANTLMGQITVLPQHIPLVAVLKPGEILIRHNGETKPVVVSGGFLEVGENEVIILADTAEHVHELDVTRAMKAVELAQKLLKEKKYDMPEYETLKTNLDKHQARVNSFRKWRK
jgi:F-type H+-transporting ATPase subunit epsilon